jgi:hypothetical protein
MHDKEWLVGAFEAYHMRREGMFDGFEKRSFEAEWGEVPGSATSRSEISDRDASDELAGEDVAMTDDAFTRPGSSGKGKTKAVGNRAGYMTPSTEGDDEGAPTDVAVNGHA